MKENEILIIIVGVVTIAFAIASLVFFWLWQMTKEKLNQERRAWAVERHNLMSTVDSLSAQNGVLIDARQSRWAGLPDIIPRD